MRSEKPILVTGGPRTGTTWVGRVIAKANSVRYIHEPFNIENLRCACGLNMNHWFTFVSSHNDSVFNTHFAHLLGFPFDIFNLRNLVRDLTAPTHKKTIPHALKNFTLSILNPRVLIKDPLAVFSAEWLATAFDMDVVVTIRHPAAFVNSFKSLNWSHPLSHFLDQPLLMKEHLAPFEAEIREYAENEHDLVDHAALLWKLVHFMILKYQRAHPDWIYIRHEDLSLNPFNRFQWIFKQLGLKFSPKISNFIEQTIDPQNPIDTEDPYSIKRNSVENVWKWKNRLSSQEIERIRSVVVDIVDEFYPESSWECPEEIEMMDLSNQAAK